MFWRNIKNQFDIIELDQKTRNDVYQQMRKVANQRIKRGGGWGTKNTPKPFKSMTELKKDNGGKIPLREIQRVFVFVTSKQTMPSERKKRFEERNKKIVDKLKQHGYENINPSDLKNFGDFMDAARHYMDVKRLDAKLSGELADIFDFISLKNKGKIDVEDVIKNIDLYIKHSEELSKKVDAAMKEGGEGKNSDDVEAIIRQYASGNDKQNS